MPQEFVTKHRIDVFNPHTQEEKSTQVVSQETLGELTTTLGPESVQELVDRGEIRLAKAGEEAGVETQNGTNRHVQSFIIECVGDAGLNALAVFKSTYLSKG